MRYCNLDQLSFAALINITLAFIFHPHSLKFSLVYVQLTHHLYIPPCYFRYKLGTGELLDDDILPSVI